MEFIYLLVAGVVLYAVSDWLLRQAEARYGRPFENRSVYFFATLLILALISFALLRRVLGA